MITLRNASLLFFLLLVGAAYGTGPDIDESAAKLRVAEFVRFKANQDAKHFLRVTRREDLDDALFLPQKKVLGKVRKTAWLFEVTETGFEILSPDEAILHSSTDGSRQWFVALNPATGQLFGLNGFPDAANSYNLLAVDAGVEIKSDLAATSWAVLYFRTVIGDSLGSILSSPTDLNRGIEDLVAAHRLSRPHSRSASFWLSQIRRGGNGLDSGFHIIRAGGAFTISTDTLGASSNYEPVLRKVTFKLGEDGQISLQSAVQLFPDHPTSGR